MYYLTFGDAPSGVLSSQAIDVCRYLSNDAGVRIKMVFFISLRQFKTNRKKLKSEYADSIVLPMLPKIDSWRWNALTLFIILLFGKKQSMIARGVLATQLALMMRKAGLIKKVGYDGRGAYAAEWHEYDVMPSISMKNKIAQLENEAVSKSDFRIAVSQKLVEYWSEQFNYRQQQHVIIPCLLNSNFSDNIASPELLKQQRQKSGYNENDIVFIYSGSTAGWQSFGLLTELLEPLLKASERVKVLFMSSADDRIQQLINSYPQQVQRRLVNHNEVTAMLQSGDYGIMIREQTITNKVAAPTKFAEYLSAGLQVLVSDNLGDYSGFIMQHHCGMIASADPISVLLNPISYDTRQRNYELARQYFTKQAHHHDYFKLINALQ